MNNGKGPISSHQMGIAAVLKGYRLRVPPNQREYSWTDEEVTTLFQDLAKAISDGESEYFLGTIATIPQETPDALEVIDGQQRLATTVILLAQIRNLLKVSEPLISDSIASEFLSHADRDNREIVPNLKLNVEDNEYFRQLMLTEPGAEPPAATRRSHELLRNAYLAAGKHVQGTVSTFDAKDHGDVLNKWVKFLEYGAQVILLKVSSDANAYKMFETLNDRGLKTTQADLVKNYLFREADSGKRLPEAQDKWSSLKGSLETLDEEEILVTFLRHALIAIRGYLRLPDVYEATQTHAKGPHGAITLLSELSGLADTYVAMFNPELESWNRYPHEIRRGIKVLNLLNVKPMRPLMLAVAAKFAEAEAATAFGRFISWQVRLLLAGGTRTGTVEQAFSAAANKVYSGSIKTAAALAKELATILPNDEQFRQSFEIATVSKASLARYYLRSLESAEGSLPDAWFIPNDDKDEINLEHVLPLQMKGNWPDFDADTARANVKRLGNQLLLTAKKNRDLGSASFDEKKLVYQGSPYALTSEVGKVDKWTPAAIAERQKRLAELGLKAWPL